MHRKDTLGLPNGYGRCEVPWPFTRIGKALDETLKSKGYELANKALTKEWGKKALDTNFSVQRQYASDSCECIYGRLITIPVQPLSREVDPDYGDFFANEVVWSAAKGKIYPLIPPRILAEKLMDNNIGEERITVRTLNLEAVLTYYNWEQPATMEMHGSFTNRKFVGILNQLGPFTLAEFEHEFVSGKLNSNARRFERIMKLMIANCS